MSAKRLRTTDALPSLMMVVLSMAIGLSSRSPAEAADGGARPDAYAKRAAAGGLRLTGRALVAVPRDDFSVFLTWRALEPDDAGTAFNVLRDAP